MYIVIYWTITSYYISDSFTFKWPRFSEEFLCDARAMLEAALNKGNKPPVIADKIEVVELEMGSQVIDKIDSFTYIHHEHTP